MHKFVIKPTTLVIAALCLLGWSQITFAIAPPGDSEASAAHVVQGKFDSQADQQSFQHALAKTFGSEIKLRNPGDTAGNSDDAANDQFGYTVALSGTSALVGVPSNDLGSATDAGSAYVFTRVGLIWSQQAKLTPSDRASGAQFGSAVALEGDTAVIGAWFDDVNANANQGSAYVYIRTGNVWSEQAKLIAGDGAPEDRFGKAVTLSGDSAIVGANGAAVGANADQGAAYVFTRTGTIWSQQSKLSAGDGAINDYFGSSVAMSGDNALIGALSADIGANFDQGAAYVFVRNGSGVWSQQVKLRALDGASVDYFGIAVALSGNTALVGAYRDNTGGNPGQGSAYVYTRAGLGVWSQQAKLGADDGSAGDEFGAAVALSGDTAIIGARSNDLGANIDQGAAYIFTRTGTVWSEYARLTGDGGAAGDAVGAAVAISGESVLIGAPKSDLGANLDQGSGYIFTRNSGVWSEQIRLSAGDGAVDDRFGFSIALSGDSALVGTYFDDIGAKTDQGSAYVFTRSGTAWNLQSQLIAADGAARDWFGVSVALAGDVALVGAMFGDVNAVGEQGAAYVFSRAGTVWSQQAKLTAADGAASDFFGRSVALSGNSALIGAVGDDVGANVDQGSAYVYTRSGSVWSQQARLTQSDGAASDNFGISVALAGDSALVGAWLHDIAGNADQGAVSAYARVGGVWSQQAKLSVSDGAARDLFGRSVALSGESALIGAYGDDVGANADQGSAYVFVRSGNAWSQQARLNALDGAAGDWFGRSIALSGDSAMVGAVFDNVGDNPDQGSAYYFTRTAGAWIQQDQLFASDGEAGDEFGISVALSGDSSVVGAYLGNSTGPFRSLNVGAAYIYRNLCTVTPVAGANGSISPAIAQVFLAGQTTSFTVTPASGYSVQGVSGCGGVWTGSNPFVTGVLNANCTVSASFSNSPPTIAVIADATVLEDAGAQTIVVTIADVETTAAALSLTSSSSQPTLIANPMISAGASPNQRNLSFAPIANQNGGPATITLTVTDAVGASSQRNFAINVTPVNDAPTLALATIATHPAATSGLQTAGNFASVDFGASDENASQAVEDFLIDSVSDSAGILSTASLDITNSGELRYTLTGVGGSATISVRVRDNGGIANAGVNTSAAQQFTISVGPGADLQIAASNNRDRLVHREITVYAIVVGNAGPNAVIGASLTDNLPATLINGAWACNQALSTASCPTPSANSGNLNASINLGVNQYLRFDVIAEVNGTVGAFVIHTVSTAPPPGTSALSPGNDSTTDQDPIVPDGLFANGFENAPTFLTVPGAAKALLD